MSYEVKGDMSVARKFSAMGGKQGNIFNINGEVDFTTAEPAHASGEIYLNTASGNGSATGTETFTAGNLYRSSGGKWGELTPSLGWIVDTGTTIKRYTGAIWAAVGGGLVSQGVVSSDADAGQGIYTLDTTSGAFNFTLPAATGTQARYMFVGSGSQENTATIAVQLGEALNNATNGFYRLTVGEIVLAVDTGLGSWSVHAIGPSTSGAYQTQTETLTYAASAVEGVSFTHSGTQGTSGTSVQIEPLRIVRNYIGDGKAHVEIYGESSYYVQDNSLTISLPNGTLTDPYNGVSRAFRKELNVTAYVVATAGVDEIVLNRDDDIDGNSPLYFQISGIGDWVGEKPSATIMAGMVTPDPLINGKSVLSANHELTSTSLTNFEDTGLSVSLPNTGTYLLLSDLNAQNATNDLESRYIITDGANAQVSDSMFQLLFAESGTTLTAKAFGSLSAVVTTTTPNEIFKIRGSKSNNFGGHSLQAGSTLRYIQLSAQTITLANPDLVTPEALDYYAAHWNSGQTFGQAPGTVISPASTSKIVDNGDGTWTLSDGKFRVFWSTVLNQAAGEGYQTLRADGVAVGVPGSFMTNDQNGIGANTPAFAVIDATTAPVVLSRNGGSTWAVDQGHSIEIQEIPSYTITTSGEAQTKYGISSVVTSSVSAIVGEILPVDASAAPVTITPPASPSAGDWFSVSDAVAIAATNNITVDFAAAGQNLHGAAVNFTLDTDRQVAKFAFVSSTIGWILAN